MIKPLKRRKLSPTQLFSLHSNSFRHQQKKTEELHCNNHENKTLASLFQHLPTLPRAMSTNRKTSTEKQFSSTSSDTTKVSTPHNPFTMLFFTFFLSFGLSLWFELSGVEEGWFSESAYFHRFQFSHPPKRGFPVGLFSFSRARTQKSIRFFFCWKLFFFSSVEEIEVLCLCVLPSSLFLLGRSKMEIFSAWQGSDFSTLVFYFSFRGRVA